MYSIIFKRVAAAPVVLARPNNVVPYVAGGVYGPAADARFQLPVPALPADAQSLGYPGLHVLAIHSRPPADAALTLNLTLAASPYATVLGDQAPFALSDADVAAVLPAQGAFPSYTMSFTSGAGAIGALNASAGIAGRRGVFTVYQTPPGRDFLAGTTLGGYLWLPAAYVPLALESITLYVWWQYNVKRTI